MSARCGAPAGASLETRPGRTASPVAVTAPRHALYFAPAPDSPLWAFGSRWLGRDAASGAALAQPAVPGIEPARLHALTDDPRRYGFHATLKPPFVLAPSCTEAALDAAAAAFAATQAPFVLPPLALTDIEGFLALTPSAPCLALDAFAGACVAALDSFRAPPAADELTRRRSARLTPRQDAMLARWGYPYVFDDFRFHMTLTQRLAPADKVLLWPALADAVAAAGLTEAPVPVAELCLFAQPDRGAPFLIRRRYPLGG